ncbi:hypothetical protein M3Y99_01030400 [Aphelenchoides fujianensis]|nr:hypothetical protein M3Y99_01030400 [Aphelenchoides fujianensis]
MNSALRSKGVCVARSIREMFGRAQEKKPKEYELDAEGNFAVQRTDWRSIYIGAFVAFIGSVHTHCISPVLWPFMKFAIPGVSENYYGMLQSLSSLAIAITGILAGYTSNLLKDTKWPMVFGKVMAIASCILYLCIERMDVEGRKVAFALFEFTLGVSVGAAGIYRAHVAMTSTEEDRPKAIGICSLAPAIGIFLGPLAQVGFAGLKYPGIPIGAGLHLNLYTAPVVLTIVISAIGAFLLVFFFDGRMRRYKKVVPSVKILDDECSTSSSTSITVETKYDWVAVALCLYTKMLLNLVVVSFSAIGIPYCMAAFGWSSQEAVLYISIVMGLVGVNIVVWNLVYIFFNLRQRLSERRAMIIALVFFLVAYLLSYPWPFLSETIPYAKPSGVNATVGFPATELVGCNPEFAWCATTPRVNMWLFLGSLITTIGFAMPLSQINLDLLFSKVLGDIKQGTMQGSMIVAGELMSIVGPIALTRVYTASGPTYIWQFEIAVIISSLVLWLVFYGRMVGKSQRLAYGMKQFK